MIKGVSRMEGVGNPQATGSTGQSGGGAALIEHTESST